MRTLVVFYSKNGHTRAIANEIGHELQCDVEEIVDTASRSGLGGLLMSWRQAIKKEVARIDRARNDPARYDLVIIGTPVWALTLSAPVRAYVMEHKHKFNKVAFFATFSGFGAERAFLDLAELCGKKAEGTLAVNTIALKGRLYTDSVKQFAEIVRNVR